MTNWNAPSAFGAVSADGAYVAYESEGSDAPGGPDTNATTDIFLWNRTANTHTRVTNGDGSSSLPSTSGDGNLTVFQSNATNLAGGPDTTNSDIFLYNRTAATLTRITDDSGFASAARISANGQKVVFTSDSATLAGGDANGTDDVFIYDIGTATTTRITGGDGPSNNAAVSATGVYVAFLSQATNLVAGDTNNNIDVFLYDVTLATTTRITNLPSVTPTSITGISGGQQFGITQVGNVLYNEYEFDPANPFVYNSMVTKEYVKATSTTNTILSGGSKFLVAPPSADGNYLIYGAYTTYNTIGNNGGNIVVWNRSASTTTVYTGVSYPLSISDNGRWALFASDDSTLLPPDNNSGTDIFLWDRNS